MIFIKKQPNGLNKQSDIDLLSDAYLPIIDFFFPNRVTLLLFPTLDILCSWFFLLQFWPQNCLLVNYNRFWVCNNFDLHSMFGKINSQCSYKKRRYNRITDWAHSLILYTQRTMIWRFLIIDITNLIMDMDCDRGNKGREYWWTR